jgi:raffinose/stachyose/melibiose transport system permease protein
MVFPPQNGAVLMATPQMQQHKQVHSGGLPAGGASRKPAGRGSGRGARPLTHLVLIAYCVFAVLPIVFIVLASVKSTPQFFGDPFGVPKPVTWSNYTSAWAQGGLLSAFRDSIVVTAVAVTVSTVVSGMAAYAVVRLRPRYSAVVQLLFVIGPRRSW